MEWTKNQYNKQYENWMPWIEDNYLYYFTKDNKTSYATKEQLDKTKITGIGPVDQIQGDVNNLLGNQLGSKGLAAPITDATSKEGINRAERGGKGDDGGYVPKMGGAEKPLDALAGGAQSAGGAVADGAKSAGGWLPGWGGSGKKEEPKK